MRSEPLRRPFLWELAGFAFALALAAIAIIHLTATDRSWLLFYDGDSVMPAIVRSSLASGQPADWASSSVLFVPELASYLALSLITTSLEATVIAQAVVSLLVFYAACRWVAGTAIPGSRSLAVTSGAFSYAVFILLACLDHSADRDGFELASLLLTATYYSATVIALFFCAGLVARMLVAAGDRRRIVRLCSTLAAVIALSTFSNPILIAWLCVPITGVLVAMSCFRLIRLAQAVLVLGVAAAASAVGLLARLPLSSVIVQDGTSYIHPDAAATSAAYYAGHFASWVSDPRGLLAAVVVVAALVVSGVASIAALRRRRRAPFLLATLGWVAPLIVVVGGILFGTVAVRYLTPLIVAPLLGVAALAGAYWPVNAADNRDSVRSRGREWTSALVSGSLSAESSTMPTNGSRAGGSAPTAQQWIRRIVIATAATVVATVLIALVPNSHSVRQSTIADREADIRCLADWVTASGRRGAATFWDGRPVKARLADQSQLIQVDATFNRYEWLVNRSDGRVDRVSFVLSGPSDPLTIPATLGSRPVARVTCGAYTITDFGIPVISLGPPHG